MGKNVELVSPEHIEQSILLIRHQKVMLGRQVPRRLRP